MYTGKAAKKRVAIITITNGANFGNRLQNYALQTVLERFDCFPETILSAKNVRNSRVLSRLRWTVRSAIKRTRRQFYFDAFNNKYIHVAPRIHYTALNKNDFTRDGYDAAVSGSDQVWNPEFECNTAFEFAIFVPPEKRYAYAASFGVEKISTNRREEISCLLSEMREISVREDAGAAIVKELTGRDVPVHVDPTLLLKASDYESIARKPLQPLPERYVLMYFLGEVPSHYRSFIEDTAARLNLPLIEVNELRKSTFFDIGPQHFLYLVQNADYLCTDSFHGTVFSILFHRPFTCFYRLEGVKESDKMGSRVDTLLRITGLENRLYGNEAAAQVFQPIDYTAVDEAVASERERATEYLREISGQW